MNRFEGRAVPFGKVDRAWHLCAVSLQVTVRSCGCSTHRAECLYGVMSCHVTLTYVNLWTRPHLHLQLHMRLKLIISIPPSTALFYLVPSCNSSPACAILPRPLRRSPIHTCYCETSRFPLSSHPFVFGPRLRRLVAPVKPPRIAGVSVASRLVPWPSTF